MACARLAVVKKEKSERIRGVEVERLGLLMA